MSRIAASDTTAIALTFAMYYIVAIPDVWNRLSDEIRSKFNAIDEITGQTTAVLPYLDAVIHECTSEDIYCIIELLAMRIRPVASGSPPRMAPPEGITILGHFISGNVFPISPRSPLSYSPPVFLFLTATARQT